MDIYSKLPQSVKVKIFQGKSGAYIAELPEYEIFTEADSSFELDFLINDLIYAYFDVPKEIQKFIRYVPKQQEKKTSLEDIFMFQQFISSSAPPSLYK